MKKFLLVNAIALGIFNFGMSANAEKLPIVHVSEENCQVLRNETQQVKNFDTKLCKLIEDMTETMKAAGGCGLAAPQVGKSLKIFVAELSTGIQEFINPVILEKSEGTNLGAEGCLSILDKGGIVERPNVVKIQAFNKNGKDFTLELKMFDARIVCHEFDHLNKTLYTDKAEVVIDTKNLSKDEIKLKLTVAYTEKMKK